MSVCEHCWNLACERARATNALDGITPIYTKILGEQERLGAAARCQSVRSRAVATAHGVAELAPLPVARCDEPAYPDYANVASSLVDSGESAIERALEGAWGDGYIARMTRERGIVDRVERPQDGGCPA